MSNARHYSLIALTLFGAAGLDVWRYHAMKPLLDSAAAPTSAQPASLATEPDSPAVSSPAAP